MEYKNTIPKYIVSILIIQFSHWTKGAKCTCKCVSLSPMSSSKLSLLVKEISVQCKRRTGDKDNEKMKVTYL